MITRKGARRRVRAREATTGEAGPAVPRVVCYLLDTISPAPSRVLGLGGR